MVLFWRLTGIATVGLLASAGSFTAARSSELAFEHVMTIGEEGIAEGQFKYVEDFAFGVGGHLLATDASHAWVQVFDRTSGKYLSRFGGKGDDDGSLDKPEGIAVAPDGTIFVADYNTGFVQRYDSSYRWLSSFSEYGSGKGQNIKSEFMDISQGRLFMPEAGNHRVSVFDLSGKFLFDFGGRGTALGELNNPEAAKVSPDGKIYVSDLLNDRIQVYSVDGQFLSSFGKSGSGPGELKSPAGLAFDKDGNVYVTEIGNSRIQVFDHDGKHLTSWGRPGSASGEFTNVHGIAIDRATGLVYVADTGNNRIQVFKPTRNDRSGAAPSLSR